MFWLAAKSQGNCETEVPWNKKMIANNTDHRRLRTDEKREGMQSDNVDNDKDSRYSETRRAIDIIALTLQQ